MTLPVSIIIPTYNRAQLLAGFLPTYFADGSSEVIIVDDASSEPVESVLERSGFEAPEGVKLRVIRNPRRLQQPRSRMIGAEAASHPHIFFGEDDAFLSPGHIKTLFDFVATGGPDAAASYWLTTTVVGADPVTPCSLPPGSSATDFVNLRHWDIRTDRRIPKPTMVPWLHTLALIRKELVLRERFDPKYRGNAFREETDFYLRAYRHGAKLYLVDAPPAFHYKGRRNSAGGQHGNVSFQSFLIYEHWVARNNYYFLQKNAEAMRSLRHRQSPFFETALYMLRRSLGYPGRLRFELRRRLTMGSHQTGPLPHIRTQTSER